MRLTGHCQQPRPPNRSGFLSARPRSLDGRRTRKRNRRTRRPGHPIDSGIAMIPPTRTEMIDGGIHDIARQPHRAIRRRPVAAPDATGLARIAAGWPTIRLMSGTRRSETHSYGENPRARQLHSHPNNTPLRRAGWRTRKTQANQPPM